MADVKRSEVGEVSRELHMDPWKFDVYAVRGPRSLAGWGSWHDGTGDEVCSWEETCRRLKLI